MVWDEMLPSKARFLQPISVRFLAFVFLFIVIDQQTPPLSTGSIVAVVFTIIVLPDIILSVLSWVIQRSTLYKVKRLRS